MCEGIPVRVTSDVASISNHEWPSHVLIPPQKGDLITSKTGGIAEIINIIHRQCPVIGDLYVELKVCWSGFDPELIRIVNAVDRKSDEMRMDLEKDLERDREMCKERKQ